MSPNPGFEALTTQGNGLLRRIITGVTLFAGFDPAAPPPAGHSTNALWDTGATGSVIAPTVVAALKLTPVGTVNVNHGGGSSISSRYVVNIGLPNRVMITGAMVTEYPGIEKDFQAIIGMDVITLGDFSITNVDAKTCMSFRIPSQERIDYVEEHRRMAFAGLGRNDPCPCGSGQKFKKCHGK